MNIVCQCPACQAKFKVEAKYAGKKARCPKCQQVAPVPALAAAPAAPRVAASSPPIGSVPLPPMPRSAEAATEGAVAEAQPAPTIDFSPPSADPNDGFAFQLKGTSRSPRGNAGHQSLGPERRAALSAVQGPALFLIVVSVICIGLLSITVPIDVLLLTNGRVGFLRLDESKTEVVVIRTIWGLALIVASGYCLFGAWQMMSLKNYQQARYAATVAVVPCLGPCCVLGIPFGAWALSVLARPEIRRSFES
jgi:hypothetical protein